ncbi:MAG: ribosome biogenesis GTP-binding protein YihA/YsxC [Gammaproteobacteria bacterium]|jgi:GTP-binding protein
MDYHAAKFVISAAKLDACPADSEVEVAFAGRSNAGKSSAINALANQPRLARTSKTPGRTQLINFFLVEPGRYLVDLPGYGFAKVPLAVKHKWQQELERYLRRREALTGLVLLSDIRHPLKEFDRMMIQWSVEAELPLHLLLTKADKLKRGAARNTLLAIRKELKELPDITVQLFSINQEDTIRTLARQLDSWLQVPDDTDAATGS